MKLLSGGEIITMKICAKILTLPREIREKAYLQMLEELKRHNPKIVKDLENHKPHIFVVSKKEDK